MLHDRGVLCSCELRVDPKDGQHERCRTVLRSLRDPLYTTIPVLTKVFHMLSPGSHGAARLRDFIRKGGASVWFIAPPRIRECPVQLEAVLEKAHPIAESDPARKGNLIAPEVRIVRVHVEERLLLAGHENRIDPDAWRPLLMSFCQFYGLGSRVHSSRLAEIPESAYRPHPRAA